MRENNPYSPPRALADVKPQSQDHEAVDARQIAMAFAWIIILVASAFSWHAVSSELGAMLRVLGTLLYVSFACFVMSRIMRLYAGL